MIVETVCLEKPRQAFKMYAIVTQLLIMIGALTIGGYLLGRYAIGKTVIYGGIFAIIGSLVGITYFIVSIIRIDRNKKQDGSGN